jgi:hypothetical protein
VLFFFVLMVTVTVLMVVAVLMIMFVHVDLDHCRVITREDEMVLVLFLLMAMLLGLHQDVFVPMIMIVLAFVAIMALSERLSLLVQEDHLHLQGVPFHDVNDPLLFGSHLVVYLFLIHQEDEAPNFLMVMVVLVLQIQRFAFGAAEYEGCRQD